MKFKEDRLDKEKTKEWQKREMPVKDIYLSGVLMEANRQFFHPHGLVLAITWEEDWQGKLWIMDARDDPEGFVFQDLTSEEDMRKYETVQQMKEDKADARLNKFGWIVQPMNSNLGD